MSINLALISLHLTCCSLYKPLCISVYQIVEIVAKLSIQLWTCSWSDISLYYYSKLLNYFQSASLSVHNISNLLWTFFVEFCNILLYHHSGPWGFHRSKPLSFVMLDWVSNSHWDKLVIVIVSIVHCLNKKKTKNKKIQQQIFTCLCHCVCPKLLNSGWM